MVALTELSSLYVTIPQLYREMCTPRLFSQWVDLFAVKFYLDRVVPILGVRKLETLCYPMMKAASLCVPSFWHNIGL